MEQINNSDVPKRCISSLNNFQFQFDKKSLCNCRFIGELFRKGALPEKVILSCIRDLSKENYEFQMHCLCTILQLTHDLNKLVNKLVSSMNNHGMSSALKCLIQQVKRMHSKGWMNEELVKFTGKNYTAFGDLPSHMKSVYSVKSNMIMSDWVYDESRDLLFNFVKNNKIDLLKMSNTWISYDPLSFALTIILVGLEENKNVRNHAGKLLDNLNDKKKLSVCTIQSGVKHILHECPTWHIRTSTHVLNFPHNIKEILDEGQTLNIIKLITICKLFNKF